MLVLLTVLLVGAEPQELDFLDFNSVIPKKQVGHLCADEREDKLKVLEVLDDHTLLIEVDTEKLTTVIRGGQVTASYSGRRRIVRVHNFPTKGLTSGQPLQFTKEQVFRLGKSELYTPADGTEQMLSNIQMVRPEDIANVKAELLALQSELEAKNQGAEFHTFTDSSGTFRVEAWLVKLEDGKVHLHKRDNSVVQVPTSRLSKDDLEWIRKEVKRRRDRTRN